MDIKIAVKDQYKKDRQRTEPNVLREFTRLLGTALKTGDWKFLKSSERIIAPDLFLMSICEY